MSTRTKKLNLINNTGSDPFLLSDFANNWAAIDASPGVYVCTSKTRPTWGTNQAGRTIVETDTFRQLIWNGGNWQEPLVAPGVWQFETAPSLNIGGNGVNTSWTLGSVSVKRACQLITWTSVVASRGLDNTQAANINLAGRIDGTNSNMSGAYTGMLQWSTQQYFSNSWTDYKSATMFGYRRVTPGTHTIGVAATTGTSTRSGDTKIMLRALSVVVMATTPSGGLSLQ